MKKLIYILTGIAILSVVALGVSSCQNDAPEFTTNQNNTTSKPNQASDLLSSFHDNLPSVLDHPITEPLSRAGIIGGIGKIDTTAFGPRDPGPGFTPIFVDSLNWGHRPIPNSRITPRWLMDLIQETGSEISLTYDGTFNYQINISDSEAEDALSPLIPSAREYLKSKGFTDTDISSMLLANHAKESDLVVFTLLLAEEEESQVDGDPLDQIFIDPSIFSHPYEEYETETITWRTVGRCALEAAGFDILHALVGTAYEAWTVGLITSAFRTFLVKAIGPVAAIVTIAHFSYCIASHA